MNDFVIEADYSLTGDQPEAVAALGDGVLRGDRYQTLLGVTGSGKTFTMANVIEKVQKPTLVIAHNKTLAAQLCNEFREFLPGNAVEYFVSYYDYYQPEAYVPAQDLYIEKDSSINDEIDRLRHSATTSLFLRREMGFCNGIENYSRILLGKEPGATPNCLLAYFPDDFLCFMDESHMSLPQVRAMSEGDKSRKTMLVDYGFRLPSALDNRPLRIDEFLEKVPQIVFVSATPGQFELANSVNIAEQIIRPTGLIDPEVEVRPTDGQIDDLMNEIRRRVDKDQRVLVTTLTKRMSEDLTDYLLENGFTVRYLHSEVDTLERIQIVRDLRLGAFDVLVGINLLREGLDLPEVTLVVILDADKEGFLRGQTALIQTIGRAARHVDGKVIMYADRMTAAMEFAIGETDRRRAKQVAFNEAHGITPMSIVKSVSDIAQMVSDAAAVPTKGRRAAKSVAKKMAMPSADLEKLLASLEAEMFEAADQLKFEYAAKLRDEIKALSKELDRRGSKVG